MATTARLAKWWFLQSLLVWGVIFVCILQETAVVVDGQKCVEFNNQTSAAYICAPYVNYTYYLPSAPTDWISK